MKFLLLFGIGMFSAAMVTLNTGWTVAEVGVVGVAIAAIGMLLELEPIHNV